jgi:DNA-binding MarR family transcriptional regulator
LNTAKKRVLRALDGAAERGFATVGNLSRAVGIRLSTASGHVDDLEGWGYARKEPNGKRKSVYITPLGSAVLKMTELWQKKKEKREKK